MRRARLLPPLLCLVAAPLSLDAQWQVSADVGASHLRRTNIPQSGAVTAGGTATSIGDRGWFRSSLLGVFAGFDRVTGQALLAGSVAGAGDKRKRGGFANFLGAVSGSGSRGRLGGGSQ